MAIRYRQEASEFGQMFADGKIPKFMSYLHNLESYDRMGDRAALPELHAADARIEELQDELQDMRMSMHSASHHKQAMEAEDNQLRGDLGVKYSELAPMIDALKRNLKRVALQCERSEPLPIMIQHAYTYSKWDQVHEPHNIVDNVFRDDDSVWKTVSPAIDLTLYRDQVCFVSYVTISAMDPAPAVVEIYSSNVPEKWTLLSSHKCDPSLPKGSPQRFLLPGEPLCKYLRILCKNNIRGGNIVAVRHIVVEGLVNQPGH
jgi:hypothetical protein